MIPPDNLWVWQLTAIWVAFALLLIVLELVL